MEDNELIAKGSGSPLRRTIITFLIGVVAGILLVVLARPFLTERLPEAVGGTRASVEGLVTAKQREGDRLLLTIVTRNGASLATFAKKVNEIDLLVEEGDTVGLALAGYRPFLEDPDITRVAKPGVFPEEPAPAEEPDLPPVVGDTTAADSVEETGARWR